MLVVLPASLVPPGPLTSLTLADRASHATVVHTVRIRAVWTAAAQSTSGRWIRLSLPDSTYSPRPGGKSARAIRGNGVRKIASPST